MKKNALGDDAILDLLKRAFLYAKPDETELASALSLDSTIDELGIQSVTALEMAGFIEEELDIQFADEDLVGIRGMRDLAGMIRKCVA